MFHLIKGKEEFLRGRALQEIVVALRKGVPDLQVLHEDTSNYSKGQLIKKLTPTLFGDVPTLVYENAQNCTDDFIEDVVDFIKNLSKSSSDTNVIITHSGVVRGKKMITAIEKVKLPTVKVTLTPELKRDSDKASFATAEFRRFNKQITQETSNAIVQYAGEDISQLAAYIKQIASDVGEETITIPKAYIDNYFNELLQVSTWDIADAAIAKDSYRALALLRQALIKGESANSIIPGITFRLKQLAKASAVISGELTAQEAGIQHWQLQNLTKNIQHFTSSRLATSFQALSDADIAAKGEAQDGGIYALEQAIEVLAS